MPPALARWFAGAGCEARALRGIGLRDADDAAIWRHAVDNGWVIVTKDEDFAVRVQATETGPCVV